MVELGHADRGRNETHAGDQGGERDDAHRPRGRPNGRRLEIQLQKLWPNARRRSGNASSAASVPRSTRGHVITLRYAVAATAAFIEVWFSNSTTRSGSARVSRSSAPSARSSSPGRYWNRTRP